MNSSNAWLKDELYDVRLGDEVLGLLLEEPPEELLGKHPS